MSGQDTSHGRPQRPAGRSQDGLPPSLRADVIRDGGDWGAFADAEAAIAAAAQAIEAWPGLFDRPLEVAIALSVDADVRKLNAQYRGIDKPTNVLSFPATAVPQPMGDEGDMIGDVILAEETLLREASELGIPPVHHLQHLVVHGVLHLLGFDHDTDAAAERMERLETNILARLGIPDPYAGAEDRAIDAPAMETHLKN